MRQFYLPTRIITGLGSFTQLPETVRSLGQRALLVCGRRSGFLDRARQRLEKAGIAVVSYDGVSGEPTIGQVQDALHLARSEQAAVIVGIGGGSAMDIAKAAAALYAQTETVECYHRGQPITERGLPFVAVPTTAGTGAEVTNNAVLTDTERGVKESLRGAALYAAVAIVDPELTVSLPPEVTAYSGADALCQAIEAFTALAAQPPTDGLATEAIRRTGRSLVRAYERETDIEARSDMLYGSLLAGMAMTNTRLGGVHALAGPLGYRYHIPHGLVCGLLLPYVMEFSVDAAPERYARVAGLLRDNGAQQVSAHESISMVRSILEHVGIPRHLSTFGVLREELPLLVSQALTSSNADNNARPLGATDLQAILEMAL